MIYKTPLVSDNYLGTGPPGLTTINSVKQSFKLKTRPKLGFIRQFKS
jgi:hypothetical protein